MMDSTAITLLLTGFLAGVGVMAAYTTIRGRKSKQATKPTKSTDPLTADFRTTEEERQKIIKDYPDAYMLAAAGLLIAIGIAVGAGLFGKDGLLTINDNGYFANVFTDVVSVLVTVFVIDRLNRRRDAHEAERALKEQLLREVRSKVHGIALNAVHQINERNWLGGESGLLKHEYLPNTDLSGANLSFANISYANLADADLSSANLSHANISHANLADADLSSASLISADLSRAILPRSKLNCAHLHAANLSRTDLSCANLTATILWHSNLSHADLGRADLSRANLSFANLSHARLSYAILNNVDLSHANLTGANFKFAGLDETTILPDGTRWTRETEMTRFTDANHQNFWRSDDPDSPAYRGEDIPPSSE